MGGVAGSAAATDSNRRNVAPHTTNHEWLMILFWFAWMSLVLGGMAGCLWLEEAPRGKWLRMARVPAPVRRPAWQRDWGSLKSLIEGDCFLPLPGGVATCAGPPRRPPAG